MLNPWQKITRVFPGKPFGDGRDGDITVSDGVWGSEPGVGWANFSGSAGSTTGSFSDIAWFNGVNGGRVGDIVLIHQTRGTGAGQWEINQIVGRSGSTLTFKEPLKYTYTSSGNSQAQIVSSGQYKNLTISTNLTPYLGWNGSAGGIIFMVVKGVLNVNANIDVSAKGFMGGSRAGQNDNNYAYRGEGINENVNTTRSRNNNANAGGGGLNETSSNARHGSGGGGGHGTSGETGIDHDGGQDTSGIGGAVVGNTYLTSIFFGGGGGGPGSNWQESLSSSRGGNGGGAVIIFAKEIYLNNNIWAKGENGLPKPSGNSCGSGGGAGGAVLLCGHLVNIGSNKINTQGGSGSLGTGTNTRGGNGGKGRIAIYYGKPLSGSVSSSYYGSYWTEQDPDLIEKFGGSFLLNFV